LGFKGLTDQDIKEKLASSQGLARPTAKDYLMDFMSAAPAMLGFPAAIATDKVLSQLAGKGKPSLIHSHTADVIAGKGKPSLIHSHTADVIADYIKKLPQNLFERINDIRWNKFNPSSRSKGHYLSKSNIAAINVRPYRKELYSPREYEKAGVEAADTLLHETAHGKVYTDLDDKEYWLRNLMIDYHDYLYDKKNYVSKYYWDDPIEVHARNVAQRAMAKPADYKNIYKNELYKSIAGIPTSKIIEYTDKDVDKYLNLKEAVVNKLMEKDKNWSSGSHLSNYKYQP